MALPDYYVDVCAECLTASCWHGTFMCERSRNADVVKRRASDLVALDLEHPSYFSRENLLRVCGAVREVIA